MEKDVKRLFGARKPAMSSSPRPLRPLGRSVSEYQMQEEQTISGGLAEATAYGGSDYNLVGATRQSSNSYNNQADSAIILPSSPNSKGDDLKSMLENSKDGQKLEAMKRLITMIAKGRPSSDSTARELFPQVVKNVVTKNAELKKLVYLYLMRYAEQEQDLALLSISSFQRSLKDPNPLIRASALRVLTSIRVPMIAPIMLIAVKDCCNDMSPYVRKTAAHSIPKLYGLDPELKDEIILIVERLLADKTSLVLGSAVAAFEEVCSDRLDLIHPHYRKFVSLMADFDEWGQVVLLNMLVRYARTQFIDPNATASNDRDMSEVSTLVLLDSDHRSLLRNSKPLLQSRNSAVVLAVVQLYLYLAPNSEINSLIVKPLIRLLHSRQEIQIVVLKNVASLTSTKSEDKAENDADPEDEDNYYMNPRRLNLKGLFEPYMKSFFIKARDSTPVKILKLKILTNLSSSSNIPLILREFQAYIQNYQGDMEFVSATIQAIGRCASRIKEIAPVCLNGLISLLSNRNEAIVAQSIIVIRTQIMNRESEEEKGENFENSYDSTMSLKTDSIVSLIVKQITKLMDKIKTPNARATIVWILAEFCDKNIKALQASPEVLRLMAKSFCAESDLVKLQIMNLSSKLFLTTHHLNGNDVNKQFDIFDDTVKERLKLLVNYVFNLAKYDLNYDVRDRGRFLKQLLLLCETENGALLAKRILMAPKAIVRTDKMEANSFDCASKYRVGTLSHFLDKKISGYEELPDFPVNQPDPSVRGYGTEEMTSPTMKFELISKDERKITNEKFYSDSEDGKSDEDEDEDEEDSGEEEAEEESGDESDEDEEESEDDEEDDEEEEDESSEEEESVKEEVVKRPTKVTFKSEKQVNKVEAKARSKQASDTNKAVDLLLDFDTDIPIATITSQLPLPQLLPLSSLSNSQESNDQRDSKAKYRIVESAEFIPTTTHELITVTGKYNIIYRFPRIRDGMQTVVELIVRSDREETQKLCVTPVDSNTLVFKGSNQETKSLEFELHNGEIKLITIGIDFKESPSKYVEIEVDYSHRGKIVSSIGDILVPVIFANKEVFESEQLKLCGMNEVIEKFNKSPEIDDIKAKLQKTILRTANLGTNRFPEDDGNNIVRYAGATIATNCLILVTVEWKIADNFINLTQRVNCERMMIGSMMSKIIKDSLVNI